MQSKKLKSNKVIAAGIVLAVSAIVGCSNDAGTENPEETTSAPKMTQREAPSRTAPTEQVSQTEKNEDFRVMPRLDGALEEDGMGLDVIIDASNKQAYADSLEWISQDASKEQFSRLENSIRYLHMYDSSVLGREAALLDVVDGKTGYEIIERAEQLMKERRGQN